MADGQLELEVTESALMADPDASIGVMLALDEAGVSFALDDFGTGYSSLAQLKRLPARTLKIDKSFVRDLASDRRDASIVQAIVHLGHDLGIAVAAEGVEQEETFQRVTEIGCDQAQGFHLGRPMPADDLAAWLER
jgi:EAL domain-containing protein (putative c-di-GMP-specific phosphodiesterase class I)